MFTQNSREALRSVKSFRSKHNFLSCFVVSIHILSGLRVIELFLAEFFRFIYEMTRLPLVPIYGVFPVKLR